MTISQRPLSDTEGQSIPCIVCKGPLTVRLAHGRKSGKAFVMLLCGRDGRHFRAFVNDRDYVAHVLQRLEDRV